MKVSCVFEQDYYNYGFRNCVKTNAFSGSEPVAGFI